MNSIFNWNERFLTHLPSVDEQHQRLVRLINDLGELVMSSDVIDSQAFVTIRDGIFDFASVHFGEEEAQMAKVGLDPRHRASHIAEHHAFIDEVQALAKDGDTISPAKARSLVNYLVNWLAYHILNVDQSMARQVRAIEGGLSAAEAFDQESRCTQQGTEPLLDALKGLFLVASERNRELRALLSRQESVALDLRKTHELLTLAQQAAQAGTWIWDMKTGQLQWSDELFRIMGLDPRTSVASFDTWRARVHPEDLPLAERQIDEAIRDHLLLINEYRFIRPNGVVCWVEAYGTATYAPDGMPLQMSGIVIDVTRRKLTESMLRQNEDAWRLALESVGDGVWTYDSKIGQANYSKQWKSILGYADDEIMAADEQWTSHVHPEDLPQLFNTMQALEVGAIKSFTHEVRMRCKDGHYKWGLSRGRVISEDENGLPIRVVGSLLDISDRKQKELALTQARQEAEQANIAKSRFLATMSHEIRTPMNGILGMAQMLLQPELKPAEMRDYAQTILNSGKSLLVLLNDILDLSKIEAGRIELESIVFNPRQILQEAQLLFDQPAGTKGLKIAAYWKGPIGQHYQGDPLRLGQMLSNLLSNAVKFTTQGQIRIEATEIERDGETALIEFSVADTGIGIPADKQHLLFQRFSQVDSSTTRQYGGSGLGLAIVANLAAQMGGSVGLESREGSGSRFHFRVRVKLARESAVTAAKEQRNPANDGIPHLSGRVLVVEDDPVNRKVIKAMLNRLGLDVMMAEDGRQGLEAVLQGDLIDLVLMDIQMPVMSGDEATRRIRRWEMENDLPRLPILALTADAFETDRQHCLAAGLDDVLAKPIDMKDLVALLRHWMPPPSWDI